MKKWALGVALTMALLGGIPAQAHNNNNNGCRNDRGRGCENNPYPGPTKAPEPGSFTLAAIGLAGLAGLALMRRKPAAE